MDEVKGLESIQMGLASPKKIRSWSHGEVLEPETINYRTLKAEKDGLFCERIFGPTKDFQCYCGNYKGRRYKGIVCDRCGVEISDSKSRRQRMGHIELAAPVAHIWFLRSIPSRMGMVLGVSRSDLSNVIYFISYIITSASEEEKENIRKQIDQEYKEKAREKKKESGKNEETILQDLRKLKLARKEALDEVAGLVKLNVLSETEYRRLSLKYGECFEAETGAEAIYRLFEQVDIKERIEKFKKEIQEAPSSRREKLLSQLKFFEGLMRANVRPEWMFFKALPVLPPGLRPMVQLDGGRYASSDLNDLYRRVINRNNRLKYLLEISAPEVIVRNEKRMLQEAIDALIDNGMKGSTVTRSAAGGKRPLKSLADVLKGKQGRFRRNLLGKRVDYSARAVIVVGPNLDLDEVGVPKEMALEVFKPFVIKELLEKEITYNVRGAKELIDDQTDEVWAALEEVVKGKYVFLNRAPTLHRISVQAFRPILIEGKAIKIPPLVCAAFNADFDGDQMALHLPLSKKAQLESKEIMLSSLNLLKPAHGGPIVNPGQDMIMGVYWLTTLKDKAHGHGRRFANAQEARLAYGAGIIDLRAEIEIDASALNKKIEKKQANNGLLKTSLGRIFFNEALPENISFYNERINNHILEDITSRIVFSHKEQEAAKVISKIKDIGFQYAMQSGFSFGMDDFVVPEEKAGLIEEADKKVDKIHGLLEKGLLSQEEARGQIIETWSTVKTKVAKIVPQKLSKHSPVFIMPDSGCRGSWAQPVQIAGMRGLMVSPGGEIIELPVKSCFKEGLEVLEYFISTHGSRKGIADKALGTAKAGYLTRRLVDMAHDVIIREEDCGSKEGIEVYIEDAREIGQLFTQKIVGRVALENVKGKSRKVIVKKGEVIDHKRAREIEEAGISKIKVRSPLSCRTLRGVCQKCYGWDLGRGRIVEVGQAVGVVAAQSIGEPGTQLTMRTFHTGGVAGDIDITQGLPRIEELFEAREPKGRAVVSRVFGIVVNISDRVVEIQPSPASPVAHQGGPASPVAHQGGPASDKKAGKSGTVKYKIPAGRPILVEKAQKVEKGEALCGGSIDPEELFRLRGEDYARKYILHEAQRIYISQGVTIHDKHLEIIAREMFSRMKITEPGDSSFLPGEIVSKAALTEENIELKKNKQQLAEADLLILGISRIALNADSFLAAASFQRTSQVLIDACLRGKVDKLCGLKENVIVGKLVPVGTGFRKN